MEELIFVLILFYIFAGAGVFIGVAGLSQMDLDKKVHGYLCAATWPLTFGVAIGRYIRSSNQAN